MNHHKYQYVVICNNCGIQPLSYDNYIKQLGRPSSRWKCPKCNQDASWDDECLETNPVSDIGKITEEEHNKIMDNIDPFGQG